MYWCGRFYQLGDLTRAIIHVIDAHSDKRITGVFAYFFVDILYYMHCMAMGCSKMLNDRYRLMMREWNTYKGGEG